jgi:chemotaxis protein CheZ
MPHGPTRAENQGKRIMAQQEPEHLRAELEGLFHYVQRVRQEIAAIGRPADVANGLDSMGDQLDAIIKATEDATNTIMAKMEDNEIAIQELRQSISDAAQLALLDRLSANGSDVSKACSFQDITGQRVAKLVKSVTYVESRIHSLIGLWGKEALESITVKADKDKTTDEKLLNGPQMTGEGMAQSEINALFD